MVQMVTTKTNTHADPPLGSRWAQMWAYMWAEQLVIFWYMLPKVFGSTREQYFHVWRSFHFDENVVTIDTYITRVKQVVVLLNYGELQILELFKNTLPSKHVVLYQINDLRTAVGTAKRVLTKEKLDKQKTGQSSASQFMKASKENSKKNSKKGVSWYIGNHR